MTMLDATAEANNRNAYDLGLQFYKASMEQLVGNDMPYVKEDEVNKQHDSYKATSLQMFDDIATMGSESLIRSMRWV